MSRTGEEILKDWWERTPRNTKIIGGSVIFVVVMAAGAGINAGSVGADELKSGTVEIKEQIKTEERAQADAAEATKAAEQAKADAESATEIAETEAETLKTRIDRVESGENLTIVTPPSPGAAPKTAPPTTAPPKSSPPLFGDVDCSDFNSSAEAGEYLTAGDPHRLDRDKDGIACNSLG